MKVTSPAREFCVLAPLLLQVTAWTKEGVTGAPRVTTVSVVPGHYVVEFASDSLRAKAARQVGSLTVSSSSVVSQIQDLGYEVEVKEDFTSVSARFQGISINIPNDNTSALADIQNLEDVSNVWAVEPITLTVEFDTNNPSRQWNPHINTRVDELHQKGLTGAGQRVCVVDTGVDFAHPALSGKVAGGKNLITDDDNLEDCVGHGTFVSSIIVGQNKDFIGVAPDAEIFMYKVFECSGSTTNDLVMKGMLTADADDCDIISVSIGSDNGYHNSPMSVVADRIGQDRVIVIAAGNSGETGVFYASSPASGLHAIAAGSTNSKQIMGWPATIFSSGGDVLDLIYVTTDGTKLNESVNAPVTVASSDVCNNAISGTADEAILLPRGICYGGKAYNTALSTGFGFFIMWDTYDQGFYYDEQNWVESDSIRLFAITNSSVGTWVTEQAANGYTLNLTIAADANTAAFESEMSNAGQMSYFSSWGPTFENDFSPSVSAPGGNVYGCFPDNEYAIASGTSFATPYLSGVAALFYAHVKKDHREFSQRLYATATSLQTSPDGKNVVGIASLAQQGAGMVDAFKLLSYTTVVTSNSKIALNDTDNRVSTHKITLHNTGTSAVTYNISHESAITVESRDEYWYPNLYYPPIMNGVAGSIKTVDSITIEAGATGEVDVTFLAPEGVANTTSGPLWSGKVLFGGSNGELVAVPYMGVEVSTYDWTPLEGSPLAFRYDENSGYLYPVDWESKPYFPAQLSSPEIYYALRYGSYEFSLDLVGEDWSTDQFSYPLQAGSSSSDWAGPVRTQPDVNGGYSNFPMQFVGRFNNVRFTRFQSFANGTDIPSGRYKILSRVLRVFGDARNPSDWQLFLSDMFRIQLGDDPIPEPASSTASISSSTATQTVSSTSSTFVTSTIVSITSTSSSSATTIPGSVTLTAPTSTSTKPMKCNQDNCLRQMIRSSAIIAPFCTSYIAAINTAPASIPTYISQCAGSPSRVSSACSCLNAVPPTSIVVTSTSSSPTSTISAVSKTTTLSSGPSPTGLSGIFRDISVVTANTYFDTVQNTNDWLALAVSINIPTRLYEGTQTSFILPPQLQNILSPATISTNGGRVGSTSFNQSTNLFTITWAEWPSWHSNIVGTFYMTTRLDPAYQSTMTEPAKYVFEIKTAETTYLPTLSFEAINRTQIYGNVYADPDAEEGIYFFDVEVPGSLGPWKSISLQTTSLGEDGVYCARTAIQLGTKLNGLNHVSKLDNVSSTAVTSSCTLRGLLTSYSSAIEADEVLRFHVGVVQGIRAYAVLTVAFYIEITYEDGSRKYQDLSLVYDKASRIVNENGLVGVTDRDGPIRP